MPNPKPKKDFPNLPFGQVVEFEKAVKADEYEKENAERHKAQNGDLVPVGKTQKRGTGKQIDNPTVDEVLETRKDKVSSGSKLLNRERFEAIT